MNHMNMPNPSHHMQDPTMNHLNVPNPSHHMQDPTMNHMNVPNPSHHMEDPTTAHQPHAQQMYDACNQYHLYFVKMQTDDGQMHDGIIEDVDQEGVTLLTPEGDMDNDHRFGYPGGFYGPGGYGGFSPYGHGYGFPRRFRRFRRRRFPLHRLRTFFFPFFY
ncbi:hypothetical protein ACJ2A9_12415 [Anaerobacillus sp. MEB173]|uniref:hypothetical protein n=1 Tax=Anaerobacillus sp. MEB173 TaxID=3383345 RepID=UPI003F92035E